MRCTTKIQQFQEFRNGRDLVRLGIGGLLAQTNAALRGKGMHQMHRRQARVAATGAAQGLAVDGHVRRGQALADVAYPGGEAAVQLLSVQEEEDAAIGVVGGDALGQSQEGAEPNLMGEDEAFDSKPGVGPTDDSTGGANEDIDEEVGLVGGVDAEVGEVQITPHELLERRRCVGSGGGFHEKTRDAGI